MQSAVSVSGRQPGLATLCLVHSIATRGSYSLLCRKVPPLHQGYHFRVYKMYGCRETRIPLHKVSDVIFHISNAIFIWLTAWPICHYGPITQKFVLYHGLYCIIPLKVLSPHFLFYISCTFITSSRSPSPPSYLIDLHPKYFTRRGRARVMARTWFSTAQPSASNAGNIHAMC